MNLSRISFHHLVPQPKQVYAIKSSFLVLKKLCAGTALARPINIGLFKIQLVRIFPAAWKTWLTVKSSMSFRLLEKIKGIKYAKQNPHELLKNCKAEVQIQVLLNIAHKNW